MTILNRLLAISLVVFIAGCSDSGYDLEVGEMYEMVDGRGACVRLYEKKFGSANLVLGYNDEADGYVLFVITEELRKTDRCDKRSIKPNQDY